jgi:uncharacterized protein (DUF1810 family)
MATSPFVSRRRWPCGLLIGIVVWLGLDSRSVGLPPFWAKYTGDALWALMIYLGIALVFVARHPLLIAGGAIAISCIVEFSQLYHAPWIDAVRGTTLGHLALGDTFAWGDILAYLVGIAFGTCLELAAKCIKWPASVPSRSDSVMADLYELDRFLDAQEGIYEQALAEIKAGRKTSHWMWFIFPQIAGLGSSSTARRYAIRDRDEAKAYLAHSVLGPRLKECAAAALQVEGKSANEVFGSPDDLKLRSCATLFAAISPAGSVFERLLHRYYGSEPDEKTLRLIEH